MPLLIWQFGKMPLIFNKLETCHYKPCATRTTPLYTTRSLLLTVFDYGLVVWIKLPLVELVYQPNRLVQLQPDHLSLEPSNPKRSGGDNDDDVGSSKGCDDEGVLQVQGQEGGTRWWWRGRASDSTDGGHGADGSSGSKVSNCNPLQCRPICFVLSWFGRWN